MSTPKRPSDDFLEICESRYISYGIDIMRAVINVHLLKKCDGDEGRAYDALIKYMKAVRDSGKDDAYLCTFFLEDFNSTDYGELLDNLDFSLARKILVASSEDGGLGLLGDDEDDDAHRAIKGLNLSRGKATHKYSASRRLDVIHQKWLNYRKELARATKVFSTYIHPFTHEQITQYCNGVPMRYEAPPKTWGRACAVDLEESRVNEINSLLDRYSTQTYLIGEYGKFPEEVDHYIAKNLGGSARSRKAIEILASHYEKYALLHLEQLSGEEYISYMEETIARFGSKHGRRYLTLTVNLPDPKLRRFYQRKAHSLGAFISATDIEGHFKDYCELTPVEWTQITRHDRDFFELYMEDEAQEILAQKEESACRQYFSELSGTPLYAQLDWLRKRAAAADNLPEGSPISTLHHAIAEQISKNQWSWQIAHVAEFVKRKPDGTYTCPAVNAPLLRDVPEYQQWLSAYEAFCKADAEEWERHNAAKLSEGIAYLSRVEETIRREKTNLAAEYKKLCDSRSPKKQVLESLLALQRRVPAVKKQLGTPSVAADSAELNHPNQLGHENFRPFFRAYPDPKPDTLTEVFRSCDAALSEFDALEKEIKARINLLRKQIHANAQHRRVTRIAVVILLLVTGYFAVQSAVLSKSDRLMQSGNLVEAYSVLDKVSAVYSKVDTRRMECLSLIRKTMVENGYRGDIVEFPDPVYPDNPVTADPTIQSGDLCVYRKQNGTYMTQIGAYWGEVRAPEGKELLAVQQGEAYFSVVGICTDGTRVRGETSWETHPKVAQSANRAAAEAGIDLEIFGEQANGFKGVWIYGGVKILMEDGSITDIFGRTNYTDVAGFVPSPDDPGNLVPMASDGSYAQPYWVSFGALPSGIHETDVFDHHYGYSAMRDGRAYSSGEWEKGNDYLFVSNSDSYLSVYDSEVQTWISSK